MVKTKNPVLALFRDTDDSFDPWGSALSAFFQVADVLWHASAEEIPAEWDYRHSPVCAFGSDDFLAAELRFQHDFGRITDDDLIFAGTVLSRLVNFYRSQGLDY
jgi:hypothetical protein